MRLNKRIEIIYFSKETVSNITRDRKMAGKNLIIMHNNPLQH